MGNVASFTATFGLDSKVSQGAQKIKGELERSSQEFSQILSRPFGEAERAASLYEKAVAGIMAKVRSGLSSEKMFADLERYSQMAQNLSQKVASTQVSFPGAIQAQDNLQTRLAQLVHGASISRQMAVPSASVVYGSQGPAADYGRNFISQGMIHGPIAPQGPSASQFYASQEAQARKRQQYAFNRNMSYPSGSEHVLDLDPIMNNEANRLSFIKRQADIIRERHFKQDPTFNDGMLWQGRQSAAYSRNMDPYGGASDSTYGRGRAAIDTRKDLLEASSKQASRYEIEQRSAEKLATSVSKLTEEEQRQFRHRVNAAHEVGRNVSTSRRALEMMDDPNHPLNKMKTGRGSWNHGFNFLAQNAAYGLEDFMISSQYGGFKAGMRAVTNNLTAMTAGAAPMLGLSPLGTGAAIAGIAVAGAASPLIYDQLTGTDDAMLKREALIYGRTSSFRDRGIDFNAGMRNRGQSSDTLVQQKRQANNEMLAFGARSADRAKRQSEVQARADQHIKDQYGWDWIGAATEGGMVRSGAFLESVGLHPGPHKGYFNNQVSEWRSNATAYRELQRLKEEEAKDWTPEEKARRGREMQRLQNEISTSRGFEKDSRESGHQLQRDLDAPQLERMEEFKRNPLGAAPISPKSSIEAANRDRQRRWAAAKKRYATDPDQLQQIFDDLNEEVAQQNARSPMQWKQHELDVQAHEDRKREHGFSVRSQMAGMQTKPLTRIAEEASLQKDRIMADRTLSEQQKGDLLGRLATSTRQRLDQAGKTPDLGNAIDAGSSEDVRLRQQYWGPRVKEGEEDRKVLEKILKALEDILAEEKKKKEPKAAGFK